MLRKPSSRKRSHSLPDIGIDWPCASSQRFIAMAAMPTRPSTTVTGGNAATSTL